MSRRVGHTMILVALLCAGCYSAPVMPPSGLIYSNVEAPVSPAVMGRPVGEKRGASSAVSYFGLVAVGDASVEAAAREGGITQPRHIDYEFVNVLLIYQKFTTVVYGE